MVDSEMATALPKWSPRSPSDGVSFACSFHEGPERTNTYAAPIPSLYGAPTTAVDPSIATAVPKSPRWPSDALSLARCTGRVNTNAEPVPLSVPVAPTNAMEPDTATAEPRPSPVSPSIAVSFASWTQSDPERMNT